MLCDASNQLHESLQGNHSLHDYEGMCSILAFRSLTKGRTHARESPESPKTARGSENEGEKRPERARVIEGSGLGLREKSGLVDP